MMDRKVELEIVVISAHDLNGVANFGRPMRTYANVWTDPSTQNSTRLDRHGRRYPTWNHKFHTQVCNRFLRQKGSCLAIQIYCKTMFGNKIVGSARMPYSDILEGYTSPDSIHFLSYRIRRPNGRPRGTVNLSVRFLDKNELCLRIWRAQSEEKYPSFPSKSRLIQGSNSSNNNTRSNHAIANNGYAIGIPVSQFAYAQHQHPRGIASSSSSPMLPSHFLPQNTVYSIY